MRRAIVVGLLVTAALAGASRDASAQPEPQPLPAQPQTGTEPAAPPPADGTAPPPAPAPAPTPSSPEAVQLEPPPLLLPPKNEVAWRPSWKKFQPIEYAITGAMLAGTAAIIIFGKEAEPNWRGPILFDKAVREELRATTPDGRRTAQTLGDAFYYGGLAYPFVVDALAVTLIGHQAPEVAAQMTLMNTEAFAITGFLSFVSNATIRRERPYVRECGPGKPDQVFPDCETGGQSEGFFSGHTAIAYTGAALTCSHHANLPLYGTNGVGGAIACISMMTGATVGGVARVYADKHYLTDVVVGAGIGLASGFIVPWLHYRGGKSAETGQPSSLHVFPMPMVAKDTGGVGAAGIF